MAIPSAFVWGIGGQRLTPEQVSTLRALEAKRQTQGVDTSPVDSWTQGAARVVDALGGVLRERRLNAADKANQAEDAGLLNSLLDGGATQGTATEITIPAAAGEVSATSPSPSMAGQAPDNVKSLVAELVPQDLQNYALNLIGKESSFNPNAVSPTGATGLAQFTKGTGRQYGLINDAGDFRADPRANINALVALTNDNRAGLAKALGRAPTEGELALAHQQGLGGAINLLSGRSVPAQNLTVNNVAPGTGPRQAANQIMAFYGGSSQAPAAEAINSVAPQAGYVDPQVTTAYQAPPPPMTAARNQPQAAPQLPAPTEVSATPPVSSVPAVQVAQAAQTPSPPQVSSQAILRALTSPYASEQTKGLAKILYDNQQRQQQERDNFIFQQQYQAQQQAQDPLRQAQIAKANRELQQPNTQLIGNTLYNVDTQQPIIQAPQQAPESVRALTERAQLSGLVPGTPQYNAFIQSGGNVQRTEAPPPAGYMYNRDANGNIVSLSAIPGSPQAREAELATQRQEKAADTREISSDLIVGSANKALDAMEGAILPTTGTLGKIASYAPESAAADVVRQIGPLQATASFETLNQMRQASPTGGALGSVSDSEQKLLQAKAGALDPFSPNFKRDLLDYEKSVLRIVHGKDAGDAIFEKAQKDRAERKNTVPTNIPGVKSIKQVN